MARGTRVVLTMQQRVEVLKDLETSSIAYVAQKYKIHLRTIRRIQQNAITINNFASRGKLEKRRKNLRKPTYEELDERLFVWFAEMRAIGHAVSDALLLQKATELKEQFGACSKFKASKGWLVNFKRRHHIRLVHAYDEKTSADGDAANSFVSNFRKYIEEENIDLENIYNMDETALLWKALPLQTVVRETKKYVSEDIMQKDRVMIGLCANATGTHKIMPLVIHKLKKLKVLKTSINQLPVIFKAQTNARMNQVLFVDWFENHFKKAVRKYQLENGLCGKVILLVDNSKSHKFPSNYEHDDHFEVKFLPPNTTFLIQPMNQGVIEKLKTCFRHKLARHLITYGYSIDEFYKKYTIEDCLYIISESWADLTCHNIKNAWKNIIPNMENNEGGTEEENIIFEMQQAWAHILEQNITVEDIKNYLTVCRKEERRLSGIVEDMNEDTDEQINEEKKQKDEEWAADEGDEEWTVDDGDEEWAADEGDEEWAADEGDEEWAADDGDKKRVADDGDKERAADEGNKECGINLPQEIRRELEDIFIRFEHCRKYIPRTARCHLDGLKLSILGNTTSTSNPPL